MHEVPQPRKRQFRPALIVAYAIVFAIVGVVGWVVVRSLQLHQALGQFGSVSADVVAASVDGDQHRTAAAVALASKRAHHAQEIAHSQPWSTLASLPVIGDTFTVIADLSNVAVHVADDAFPPTAQTLTALYGSKSVETDRHFDVSAMHSAAASLAPVSSELDKARRDAQAVPRPSFPPLGILHDRVVRTIERTAAAVHNSTAAASVIPAMLGEHGPRSYLLVVESGAETRGAGGAVIGAGILRADGGTISLDRAAAPIDLLRENPPLDFGPDFQNLYGGYNPTRGWLQSDVSPHFPYSARIWQSQWEQQTHELVNGVIAVDTTTLSYLLDTIDGLDAPDGQRLTSATLVDALDRGAVERFGADLPGRAAYVRDIAFHSLEGALSGPVSNARVLDALGRAIAEHRVAVWSSDPAEQAQLESTPVGRALPAPDSPNLTVAVNNLDGTKLDYSLDRVIDYRRSCNRQTSIETVTVTLTREVNGTVPDNAVGAPVGDPAAPKGTGKLVVSLYAPAGSQLTDLQVNGEAMTGGEGVELGHPVYSAAILLDPDHAKQVRFTLTRPVLADSDSTPEILIAGGARPATISTDVEDC